MASGTPSDVAARWAQRLGAASQKITQGVQAVTVAPQQKAAAAVDTWLARLNDPATRTKYVASLQRSSLADWQNAMLQKGISRISAGAQQAQPKFEQFLSQFLPFVESVAARVRQMPKATLEDRINRATAQIRGTAQFKRS